MAAAVVKICYCPVNECCPVHPDGPDNYPYSDSDDDEQLRVKALPYAKGSHYKGLVTGQWYVQDGHCRYWNGRHLLCRHLEVQAGCDRCHRGGRTDFAILPPPKHRVLGMMYLRYRIPRIWSIRKRGKPALRCQHNWRYQTCPNEICSHHKEGVRCEHGWRYYCIPCKGGGICTHLRCRPDCWQCGGCKICKHNITKYLCNECDGRHLCLCGRNRWSCVSCGGHGICGHGVVRSYCKPCGGSAICQHSRRRSACLQCFSHPQNFCSDCEQVYIANNQGKYGERCFRCYCQAFPDEAIPRRRLKKQHFIHQWLQSALPAQYILVYDRPVGPSARRPDWLIDCGSYVVIVECDENAHRTQAYRDTEAYRLELLQRDLSGRPLVVIRFNPDRYQGQQCFEFDDDTNIVEVSGTWSMRRQVLLETLQHHLRTVPAQSLTELCLFYSA
jgi:hypothetical protein